jgi:predicted RNA-binding Zn-ribbon protein involved in translation (DUF1610 family)
LKEYPILDRDKEAYQRGLEDAAKIAEEYHKELKGVLERADNEDDKTHIYGELSSASHKEGEGMKIRCTSCERAVVAEGILVCCPECGAVDWQGEVVRDRSNIPKWVRDLRKRVEDKKCS